jgi:hypothetical protein
VLRILLGLEPDRDTLRVVPVEIPGVGPVRLRNVRFRGTTRDVG